MCKLAIYLSFGLLLTGCTTTKLPSVQTDQDVRIIGIHEKVPTGAKLKGKFKIGYFPPFLATYKNYDSIIKVAQRKVLEDGGNLLKIVSHIPYQFNIGDNEIILHKIKAEAYYLKEGMIPNKSDETVTSHDAILKFYRFYQV